MKPLGVATVLGTEVVRPERLPDARVRVEVSAEAYMQEATTATSESKSFFISVLKRNDLCDYVVVPKNGAKIVISFRIRKKTLLNF